MKCLAEEFSSYRCTGCSSKVPKQKLALKIIFYYKNSNDVGFCIVIFYHLACSKEMVRTKIQNIISSKTSHQCDGLIPHIGGLSEVPINLQLLNKKVKSLYKFFKAMAVND